MTQKSSLAPHFSADLLSDPEITGLTLVAKGMSTAEVAQELGMEEDRIETMFRGIQTKLGAANRVNAVAIAIRLGLIGIEA